MQKAKQKNKYNRVDEGKKRQYLKFDIFLISMTIHGQISFERIDLSQNRSTQKKTAMVQTR